MGKLLSKLNPQSRLRSLPRRLAQSPTTQVWGRYVVPVLALLTTIELLRQTSLDKPASDVLVLSVLLLCSWLAGVGPALLLSPTLFVLSRVYREPSARWALPDSEEIMGLTAVTLICVSVALVGQFRRRIRAVTAQHASKLEDQARALNLAAILFRDINGQITQWNQGTERLFGWTSNEAIGRLSHELLQSRFIQPLAEIQQTLTRMGQWHGEVVHRHKGGAELHVATQWILYRDKAGVPIGVAELHNDVTALRLAEAAVRDADRRKDEFLAVLAHELRNPLAPIRTGLELMRTMEGLPKPIEEMRSIMERQTCQLVRLVDDLLDISRISCGKLELRKSEVALSEVVQSAVETATPMIQASGHTLNAALPEAPIYLHADPNRLAQVLSNLLDNASKYTPAGGKICLSASRVDNRVVVSIQDNGVGIPADMLERIFDMFTRTQLTGIDYSGLGIGLALVKSIIEMHGGHIKAHSDGPGRGSLFHVTLPVSTEATAPKQLPSSVSTQTDKRKYRVLIADDNRAAASLLGILITNFGNVVRIAHDGELAIEAAREFKPEIVLMDLGMPRLDGYEACRHIREQPWGRDMLMVALTGWGQEQHRRRAQESGFDHYLVKPADPAELQRLFANPDALRSSPDPA